MTTTTMTFEQFKADLERKHGAGRVLFTEHGKDGWTDLEGIVEGKPESKPGPRWCDAAPWPRTGRLLGTYDFNGGTATFY
jgi:hypothetical protein